MGCKLFLFGWKLRGRWPILPGQLGHLPQPWTKQGSSMDFLSFAEKSPQRSHQLYLSSSQGSISCKCNATVFRGKRSQTCNHRPWKKHRSQPPDFARSTEFVRQYWINTNLTLAANNPHALTFAPSLILLASLQILAQRLMISSLPCQKNCWAWQRSGKLSTESSTSAAGFLACLELLLTPLIAQLCKPVESNLYLRENFQHTQTIWERMPLRDPHFPDRKKYEYL